MMFEHFKKSIKNGANVADTAKRIGIYHLRGMLSDNQADELYDLMHQCADYESNRPEVEVSLAALNDRLQECEDKIKALQDVISSMNGSEVLPPTETPEDDYPDWMPWDGVSHNYRYGDIVRHNNELWISDWIYQNTWEPGVMGTEKMWKKYIEPIDDLETDGSVAENN